MQIQKGEKTSGKGSLDTEAAFQALRPARHAPENMLFLNDVKAELIIPMGTMTAIHLRNNLKQSLKHLLCFISKSARVSSTP